jgi:endonuclease YncB( thermonuclease family)
MGFLRTFSKYLTKESMKKATLISLVALFISFSVCAQQREEIHGIVKAVVDGNTLIIATAERDDQHILMHGVDSPEAGQRFATEAKKYLERLLLNKTVTIVIHGKDRRGNRLGEISIDGIDPRKELVKAGLAWTYGLSEDHELNVLNGDARRNGSGIWSESNPTPPWIFRQQQSMLEPKTGA